MKTVSFYVWFCAAALVGPILLKADERPRHHAFSGIWRNTDPNTGGLARLAIYTGDKIGTIQAWGACGPELCDLGPTQLNLVGKTTVDRDLDQAFAAWNLGFADIYALLHLIPAGLAVDLIEIIQDGSYRSNYIHSYLFEKTFDPAGSQQLQLTQELLASYDFDQGGRDRLNRSLPINLTAATVIDGVLMIPEFPLREYSPGPASIDGFSYESFAVSLDFNPCTFADGHSVILSGGPGYRWLVLNRDENDQITLSLNGHSLVFRLGGVAQPGRWHKLICSVDLKAQQINTFLDGQPLSSIRLQDFEFNVIGTNFEEWDKAFSFWDFGNAENFCGMADNLKVYRRALTSSEMSVLSSANLVVERANGDVVVHWPALSAGYSIEFTDSLSPTPLWVPYTGKTLPIGDRQLAVFFAPHDAAFFRLRRN